MLNELLSSAVIAAVIASIFTWVTCQYQQSNSYITAERAARSLRLKKAMEMLVSSCGKNKKSLVALQQIKCEINPYGRLESNPTKEVKSFFKKRVKTVENKEHYLQDGHIWRAIKNYEIASSDQKDAALNILLRQLEYLLKYDWERSKKEIRFNAWLVGSFVSTMAGLAVLIILAWQTNPLDVKAIAFEFCVLTLFLIFSPYLYTKGILSWGAFFIFFLIIIASILLVIIIGCLTPSTKGCYNISAVCFCIGFALNVMGSSKSKSALESEYIKKIRELDDEVEATV